MKSLTLVVAKDLQNGIGKDGKLPWHLPEDMAHFKSFTMGKPIIMGRKTFESIGRALPGRRNIVLSTSWRDKKVDGVEFAWPLSEAVSLCGHEHICVIGGRQTYEWALHHATQLMVTQIDAHFDCDTHFPHIDPKVWQECYRKDYFSHALGCAYSFIQYTK